MDSPTDINGQVQAAVKDPSGQGALMLERLYRQSIEEGQQESFCAAITRALSTSGRSALLDAWGYRLKILPVDAIPEARPAIQSSAARLWGCAVVLSVLLGLVWSVFSRGKPPMPIPEVAAPLFWLGWAPVTALFIMGFTVAVRQARDSGRIFGTAALTIGALSLLSGWTATGREGAVPLLIAFHLPFLAWITVGAAATTQVQDRAVQRMSFILKSAEALLAAGIYVAGMGIFGGLTLGIFAVLGVRFPADWISRCAALAIGVVPVLAIATTYDPRLSPAEQDFSTGPARLMRLFSRLLLAPVLGVLAVYLLWFIPRYFWRPFEERAVLITYNASLAAVLMLIVLAVPYFQEEISAAWLKLLRQGIRAICFFALILNIYSLSAVIVRTIRYGISPNRHAIIGWDLVTLCILASILIGEIRSDASNWTERFRKSFARFLPLVTLWALWVLLFSPWIQ